MLIVFGFSDLGKRMCDENYEKVVSFCDNSSKVNGETYKEIACISVENAVKKYPEANFLICSLYHAESMTMQLESMGVNSDRIIHLSQKDIEKELQRKKECKHNVNTTISVEIDLAKHCNLKCKSCHHFSNIAPIEFPDMEEFTRDLVMLKKTFDEKINHIFLLGGEPLLNPEISKYLNVSRRILGDCEIELVTNGLLIMQMDDLFWDTCRDNNIIINITKYPIRLKYEEIAGKCREKSVQLRYFGNEVEEKEMSFYPLDLEGRQDREASFYNCNLANRCVTLSHGRLYPCCIPSNICYFNRRFEKDIKVSEKDGISIYEGYTSREIQEFLSMPIPFCKYCMVNKRTYDNKWEKSNMMISEWVIE